MKNNKKILALILFFSIVAYTIYATQEYFNIKNKIQIYETYVESVQRADIGTLKTINDMLSDLGIELEKKDFAAYKHKIEKKYTDEKNNKYEIINKIRPYNRSIYDKTEEKTVIQNTIIKKYNGYAGGGYFLVKNEEKGYYYFYYPNDVYKLYKNKQNSNMILFDDEISDVDLEKLFDLTNYEEKISEYEVAEEFLKTYLETDIKKSNDSIFVHANVKENAPDNIKEFFKHTSAGSSLMYDYQSKIEKSVQEKFQKEMQEKVAQDKADKEAYFKYFLYLCGAVFLFTIFGKQASSMANTASNVASNISDITSNISTSDKTDDDISDKDGIIGNVELHIDSLSDVGARKYNIEKVDGRFYVRTGLGDNDLWADSESEIRAKIDTYCNKRKNLKKITINL